MEGHECFADENELNTKLNTIQSTVFDTNLLLKEHHNKMEGVSISIVKYMDFITRLQERFTNQHEEQVKTNLSFAISAKKFEETTKQIGKDFNRNYNIQRWLIIILVLTAGWPAIRDIFTWIAKFLGGKL